MLNLTYTYRLKLTNHQEQTYERWLETSRQVWNFKGLSRGMLGKHCLDASFGQFLTILEWVCWKRGVYFAKVDPRGTSQICPNCQHHTGKKELSERVHYCDECGYTTDRDVAAAQIVDQRGLAAVGYTVKLLGEGLSISSPLTQESPTL